MPCTSRTSIPTGRGWKYGWWTNRPAKWRISTHYEDAKDCSIIWEQKVRVTTDAVAPDRSLPAPQAGRCGQPLAEDFLTPAKRRWDRAWVGQLHDMVGADLNRFLENATSITPTAAAAARPKRQRLHLEQRLKIRSGSYRGYLRRLA